MRKNPVKVGNLCDAKIKIRRPIKTNLAKFVHSDEKKCGQCLSEYGMSFLLRNCFLLV